MKSILTICLLISFCSCSRTVFYVVRHAEKATAAPNMSSDVELTDAGKQRAERLKEMLIGEHIGSIFSTQTIRTTSTAKPLSESTGVPVVIYNHRDTVDKFIARVKAITKNNVLIVGHSNTVDDIVNKLMNAKLLSDLEETEYDNLFIVKRKGKKYNFERKKY